MDTVKGQQLISLQLEELRQVTILVAWQESEEEIEMQRLWITLIPARSLKHPHTSLMNGLRLSKICPDITDTEIFKEGNAWLK